MLYRKLNDNNSILCTKISFLLNAELHGIQSLQKRTCIVISLKKILNYSSKLLCLFLKLFKEP
jgi:hypothetical protein